MKNCPFCHKEIQDQAIKCRYCHQMLGMNGHTKPTLSPANMGIFAGLCAASYGFFLLFDARTPPNANFWETGGFWMALGAVVIVLMLIARRYIR